MVRKAWAADKATMRAATSHPCVGGEKVGECAWTPAFGKAGETRLEGLYCSYRNGRRFFVLELEGHIHLVEIPSGLKSGDDVKAAAVLPGQDRRLNREIWHKVTLPDLSLDVFGYAAIGRTDELGSGPVYAPTFVMGRVGTVPGPSLSAY